MSQKRRQRTDTELRETTAAIEALAPACERVIRALLDAGQFAHVAERVQAMPAVAGTYLWPVPGADGLYLRIGPRTSRKGEFSRTWVVAARFPGERTWTRKRIGRYPAMDLAKARARANNWRGLIDERVNPRELERQQAAEAERQRVLETATFSNLVADYFADSTVKKQRKFDRAQKIADRDLLPVLGPRSIASITRDDVEQVVADIVKRGTTGAYGRNVLQYMASMFTWGTGTADRRRRYGITVSPCIGIKPKFVVGPKLVRSHAPNLDDVRAIWKAAGTLGYPYGPLVRLLVLTGCRRAEIGDARWNEFDARLVALLKAGEPIDWLKVPDEIKLMTIPAARQKSGREHLVPLSNAACAVLAELPHFPQAAKREVICDHLFSTTSGVLAVDGFSAAKKDLDEAIVPAIAPWVFHDLRRSLRSAFSEMGVRTEAAELAIGHAPKGIQGVYDRHKYLDERREAFERWAARVLGPGADMANVVRLRA